MQDYLLVMWPAYQYILEDDMNLMGFFTGIAGIVGLALLSGMFIGIPTFIVLLLLKLFGVI